jgi:hypothetical protein
VEIEVYIMPISSRVSPVETGTLSFNSGSSSLVS